MKHIVILKKKYLDLILEGKKTIESRWSMNKRVPYNKIKIGDTLYLKETGKDVTFKVNVKDVKFYELNEDVVDEILDKYGDDICINKENKESYNKKYCTLIWIDNIKEIEPFKVKKSYGSGWIVLED